MITIAGATTAFYCGFACIPNPLVLRALAVLTRPAAHAQCAQSGGLCTSAGNAATRGPHHHPSLPDHGAVITQFRYADGGAIPIANDQPAVVTRVALIGNSAVVPLKRSTADGCTPPSICCGQIPPTVRTPSRCRRQSPPPVAWHA